MSLNIYFDAVKKKLDIERDAVLARKLGMTPQHLNRARKQGYCSDVVIHNLGVLLPEIPLEEILLAREASKPDTDGMHEFWQRAYEKVKRRSAVLGIGAVLLSGSLLTGERANAATLRDEFQRSLLPEIARRRKLVVGYFFLRFFGGFKPAISCI